MVGGKLGIEKIFSGELASGEEVDFSSNYGLLVVASPDEGETAIYSIGAYPKSLLHGREGVFGDWTAPDGVRVILGRKETNGKVVLKNNTKKSTTIRIARYGVIF